MKVTELIYICDYGASQKMESFHFHYDCWPMDITDEGIKKALGDYDQVVLARIDDGDEFEIIYDKYKGWINGFEHFNKNKEDEINE